MKDQEILDTVFSRLPQKEIRAIILYPNKDHKENLCVILEREGCNFHVPSTNFDSFSLSEITFVSLQRIVKMSEKSDLFIDRLEKGRWLYNKLEQKH